MTGRMLLLVLLVASSPTLASTPAKLSVSFSSQKLRQIQDNLLVCFASDDAGIRISAALALKLLKDFAPGELAQLIDHGSSGHRHKRIG